MRQIEVGFVQRKRLNEVGEILVNLANSPRLIAIEVKADRENDQIRAKRTSPNAPSPAARLSTPPRESETGTARSRTAATPQAVTTRGA